MQITGVPFDAFTRIVSEVSARDYAGNVIVHRDSTDLNGKRAPRIRVRLTVAATGAGTLPATETLPGVRRSASPFPGENGPRRISAACWHAYRDALTAVFAEYPDAIVRTAMAQYRGRDGFESAYPATGDRNIGSLYRPVCAADACDCETRES